MRLFLNTAVDPLVTPEFRATATPERESKRISDIEQGTSKCEGGQARRAADTLRDFALLRLRDDLLHIGTGAATLAQPAENSFSRNLRFST